MTWPGDSFDDLLTLTSDGLYCPLGGFHVDPWRGVELAVVTHAHSDHARSGSRRYLCSRSGAELLAMRVGRDRPITPLHFGQRETVGDVTLSLHPAGHILGSAQVRIEHRGRVVVVGGDHNLGTDAARETFEPVACDYFISEATFALPIYRWPRPSDVFAEINDWWRENAKSGRTSVLFAYAVGKAQRVLAGVDASLGPIGCHGAVERFNDAYRRARVSLPPTLHANADTASALRGRGLIVAPPSADDTPWLRRFGPRSTGFASGWMCIRGTRRRRNLDRGFVLSDHADFPGLIETIRLTGARRIGVTHGYTAAFSRLLVERGWDARIVPTRFSDTEEAGDETVDDGKIRVALDELPDRPDASSANER